MPRPTEGESEQDFVSRFMESAEALRDYPDESQRLAVAYSMFREHKNRYPEVQTMAERENIGRARYGSLKNSEQEVICKKCKTPFKVQDWDTALKRSKLCFQCRTDADRFVHRDQQERREGWSNPT
jgi:hypothetical protein